MSFNSRNQSKLKPLSPQANAFYERLATPVNREYDAVSGSTEDQIHCRFQPTLSSYCRSRFPENGGFLDRVRHYTQKYHEGKMQDPPPDPECTFKPWLTHRKDKSRQELAEKRRKEKKEKEQQEQEQQAIREKARAARIRSSQPQSP